MKAVNLLPPDLRRGSGAPARSGLGVYVALGALAVAVVLASATSLLHRQVADRKAAVATAQAQATAAQQRAATLSRYKQLAASTGSRVQGVRKVAAGRVDWSRALSRISQAVGTEVAFASLNASSTPGSGGSGSSNPLRGAVAAPAVEVVGCARDHTAVARLMSRMRAMDFVRRVSLASSEQAGAAAAGSASSGGGDCHAGGLRSEFSIVIFLTPPAGAAPAAAAGRPTPPSAGAGASGASGASGAPAPGADGAPAPGATASADGPSTATSPAPAADGGTR